MRRINAVLSLALIVLFFIHGIFGGFQAAGIFSGGGSLMTAISYILLTLCFVHAVIGVVLTVRTFAALKKSGTFYFKENLAFWTRRISGLAVIIFIAIHTVVFTGTGTGAAYRLVLFDEMQLVLEILMIISVAVHVVSTIKPLFISFGVSGFRAYIKDFIFVLAIVCLFCAAAFLVYFLRWNVLWR